MADSVIITCAITGAIHTPSMSPHLPVTPAEIAEQAIVAAEAGASILHLHARNPETGEPAPDPAVFRQFLPVIKQSTEAVVNITTGGGLGMSIEDRLAAAVDASPEMASLNMGSINFGTFPMLEKYSKFKYDWEREYLARTVDFIFPNTFKTIEYALKNLGDAHGTKFEFECYDVGHLYNLAYFVDKGLVKPPFFIQFVLGILGGIGADPENLAFLDRTAKKLFGDQYEWSVLGAGRHQMPLATQAALLGGNLRVGLEDSLYISRGELAVSNAQQVTKIRRIIEELGMQVASPAEARARLGLKGGDRVGF
ncbi:MAG: 3-keto-5-aminohexanoate cleavage protein [Rhodobacteraceae bacterium]|nr:3-keto-5-aminohexanoate cleavage protein [Paracoccaceae bacterium]